MAKNQKKNYRLSTKDKILIVIFYALTALFSLLCLYPFYQVIISSFADETTLIQEGYRIIPSKFSLDAYKTLFASKEIWLAYGVTILITVVGTIFSLFINGMCAYALSGKKLKHCNLFNFIFYFTMLFSGGMIPTYILITNYLHLNNNLLVYIIPCALNVWNMFLLRNFFNEIPTELIENAELEGANEFTIAMKVIVPLSKPVLATVGLFTALGYWNIWMESMLYMNDANLYTLQYIIVRMVNNISAATNLGQSGLSAGMVSVPANTLRLATAVVTIGPIIFLYPFLQKYFVAGLRTGSIKG